MTLGFNSTVPSDSELQYPLLTPHSNILADLRLAEGRKTQNPAQHLPAFSINYQLTFQHPVYFHMLTNFRQAMCLTFTSLQKKTGGWGVNILVNSANCAAIPTGLLESELFGHERGAFTGAIAQKVGRLELADGGSLFLDEIGDIPLELQPKLLRVLQEREFERLGSTRTKKVDVRVVAATHRDLEEMISKKEFRSDLYYRLNVFPISIPPLRERTDDIPLLVRHFVQEAALRMSKTIDTIPPGTMEALTQYGWPGNIRELENVIERAVILTPSSTLHVPLRDLRSRILPGNGSEKSRTLADVERDHIRSVLQETRWVLSGPRGAAARLGLNRSTLHFRMKKLGIVRSCS